MAKSNNQKAKILYLEKMLRETGEHQVISMQKILENLEKQGIRAERKSIYDDVEVLRYLEWISAIQGSGQVVIIWQDSAGGNSRLKNPGFHSGKSSGKCRNKDRMR